MLTFSSWAIVPRLNIITSSLDVTQGPGTIRPDLVWERELTRKGRHRASISRRSGITLPQQQECGSVRFLMLFQHGVTLFDGGAGNIAQRLLSAQADQ